MDNINPAGSWRFVFLAPLLFTACSPRIPDRPSPVQHVVFIVVDSLRADHLSAWGRPRATTPAIDRIAATGVQFENAYSVAPWTLASVASALTGLYPRKHGAFDPKHVLPEEVTTIAEILLERGFFTAAVVSNELLGARYGMNQGFSAFDEEEARGHQRISGEGVTQRAVALIEQANASGKRLFLYVHYFDPHFTYKRHPQYGFSAPGAGRLQGGDRIRDLYKIVPTITPEERGFLMDSYDEEIRYTDDCIGRVLDSLVELGIDDKTLIVLTADHGEEFAERGWLGHTRTLYEELVRVPLVFRVPGVPGVPATHGIVRAPVSLVGLPATMLELLGLDVKVPKFQVGPFTNLLSGSGEGPPDVYLEVDFDPPTPNQAITRTFKKGIIKDGWKLIRDDRTRAEKLYDLGADPGESGDLAAGDRARVTALADLLDERIAEAGQDAFEPRDAALSEAQVERLRALGYAGGGN